MMWFQVWHDRRYIKNSDDRRDSKITPVPGVTEYKNISYNKKYHKWGLLDVYKPEGKEKEVLPVLLIVHGGGLFYGTKETYHLYSRYLSSLGFTVVCYSYPLAPRKHYPNQLYYLDEVMGWIKNHQKEWAFDLDNVFLVGDSAGGYLSFNYAVADSNPSYRALYNLKMPLRVRGALLACSAFNHIVFFNRTDKTKRKIIFGNMTEVDPRLHTNDYVTKDICPLFIFTSEKDFLLEENLKEAEILKEKGIPFTFKKYTSKEGDKLEHVFHCNLALKEALECNQDQANFALAHLSKKRK